MLPRSRGKPRATWGESWGAAAPGGERATGAAGTAALPCPAAGSLPVDTFALPQPGLSPVPLRKAVWLCLGCAQGSTACPGPADNAPLSGHSAPARASEA